MGTGPMIHSLLGTRLIKFVEMVENNNVHLLCCFARFVSSLQVEVGTPEEKKEVQLTNEED
jgi:hypothetical protein